MGLLVKKKVKKKKTKRMRSALHKRERGFFQYSFSRARSKSGNVLLFNSVTLRIYQNECLSNYGLYFKVWKQFQNLCSDSELPFSLKIAQKDIILPLL